MSRAFVRESDQEAAGESLPERPVSEHPNLVTAQGLQQIEEQVRALELERQAARAAAEDAELPRIARDLRYWSQRLATARLVAPLQSLQSVRFGARVSLRLHDASVREFQIVGEDEADPARGLISWVSPLAESMLGKAVGETIGFQDNEVKISAINA